MVQDLRHLALECLVIPEPDRKCEAVAELAASASRLSLDPVRVHDCPEQPGRPQRPRLVGPTQVPRRRLGSPQGKAALVHAIAHIEFNAINLALDAVVRFSDMPKAYYLDWLSVADDEARHFRLLQKRLQELGYAYGDFDAHNGLWEMAEKTADRCLVRMALVPRVLEARGLDVTPGMIRKLEAVGDVKTIEALEVILREEVRHVAIGSEWFRYCCRNASLDPEATFLALLREYYTQLPRGPFNMDARLQAGFSEEEMQALMGSEVSTQNATV